MNELFGFISRCATLSAGHLTDYVINKGTAVEMAGGVSRAAKLLEFGLYAGYLVEIDLEEPTAGGTPRRGYKIIEDADFMHLKTKAEVEWERERRNDAARPELTIPVRLRDGDGCRYCGKVVRWGAQNSAIGGTYDHRIPGVRAKDENDMFVACRGCNGGRKNRETADQDYPRLPVPTRAYFSQSTVDWLRDHDYVKRLKLRVPRASGRALQPGDPTGNGNTGQQQSNGTTGSAPTGDGATGQTIQGNGTTGPSVLEAPATGSSHTVAPEGDGTADRTDVIVQVAGTEMPDLNPDSQGSDPHCQLIANPANCLTEGPGNAGTGRDGTGRVGQGREGPEAQPSAHPHPAAHLDRPPNVPEHPQASKRRKRPRRRK